MNAPVDVLAVFERVAMRLREPQRLSRTAQGKEVYAAQLDEARIAVRELIEAAGHRVAQTFEQARDMADKSKSPIWCEVDPLNPCWVSGRPLALPLKHWEGLDDACPECRLRAALARVGGAT